MASQQSLYPTVQESKPDCISPFSLSTMASQQSLYPTVHESKPDCLPSFRSTLTPSAPPYQSMYPTVDTSNLAENLFLPSSTDQDSPTTPTIDETLIHIPGAILHLIDKHRSVELSCGDLFIQRLSQGDTTVAILIHVTDSQTMVNWPLSREAATVKLDDSHYFFSISVPEGPDGSADLLNYGLTFASKGQEALLKEFDEILQSYTGFSEHRVMKAESEVIDGSVAKEVTAAEVMEEGEMKDMMEERSAAYWTALAPNVEDYSSLAAKAIAAGSGQLVRGILWCSDVTVDQLKWGNDMLKKRMAPGCQDADISPEAMKRIERVKKVTAMSEKVATGILSGVVKITGYFTSSIINSKAGKKIFGFLPGEVVLASLDGFGKICDAVEVAGKSVMSTSSDVTTGLVSHRYGEQASEFTKHGLDSAGHAMGTAWAVFKIRKALDPKASLKPTSLTKSALKAAAAEIKSKKAK